MVVLISSSPRSAREDDRGALLVRRENGTCSSRERYLFVVRTVLVRRENVTYNVDRARTWLRGSGCLPAA